MPRFTARLQSEGLLHVRGGDGEGGEAVRVLKGCLKRGLVLPRESGPKSKESDLELKLNELVVELGRSLQKIAQPIQSSMNRTLMSV